MCSWLEPMRTFPRVRCSGLGPSSPQEQSFVPEARGRPKIAIITAFQAEGIVLIDMAHRIRSDVRAITVDTGRLPRETYALIDQVRGRTVSTEFPWPTVSAALARMAAIRWDKRVHPASGTRNPRGCGEGLNRFLVQPICASCV
ncbi:MAG: phosphoadenosine phosphosulfate reductase family protein [Actinomycetota bacterium]